MHLEMNEYYLGWGAAGQENTILFQVLKTGDRGWIWAKSWTYLGTLESLTHKRENWLNVDHFLEVRKVTPDDFHLLQKI